MAINMNGDMMYPPGTVFTGGSSTFNEAGNQNIPAPKAPSPQTQAFDMNAANQRRAEANKRLHGAKTKQEREAASRDLMQARLDMNINKDATNTPYHENRSAAQIARQGGTPNVRTIYPGQNNGGQPGGTTPQTGGPSYVNPNPGNPAYPGQPGMPNPGTPGGNNPNNPVLPNPNGTPPSMFGNLYQQSDNPAFNQLGSLFDQSTNGTLQSFNTSANRLRERIDSQTAGLGDQARNRNLSRGFGASGVNDADQFKVNQSGQQAYANGLNDLMNNMEQNRLQGLQTGLGAASSMREGVEARNNLGQADFSQARGLSNSNWQQGQQLGNSQQLALWELMNNREQRTSNEGLAGSQLASQDRNALADRDLQKLLGELSSKTSIYNNSLNLGSNQNPYTTNLSNSLGGSSQYGGRPNPTNPYYMIGSGSTSGGNGGAPLNGQFGQTVPAYPGSSYL